MSFLGPDRKYIKDKNGKQVRDGNGCPLFKTNMGSDVYKDKGFLRGTSRTKLGYDGKFYKK